MRSRTSAKKDRRHTARPPAKLVVNVGEPWKDRDLSVEVGDPSATNVRMLVSAGIGVVLAVAFIAIAVGAIAKDDSAMIVRIYADVKDGLMLLGAWAIGSARTIRTGG